MWKKKNKQTYTASFDFYIEGKKILLNIQGVNAWGCIFYGGWGSEMWFLASPLLLISRGALENLRVGEGVGNSLVEGDYHSSPAVATELFLGLLLYHTSLYLLNIYHMPDSKTTCIWGDWGTERLSSCSKIAQLLRDWPLYYLDWPGPRRLTRWVSATTSRCACLLCASLFQGIYPCGPQLWLDFLCSGPICVFQWPRLMAQISRVPGAVRSWPLFCMWTVRLRDVVWLVQVSTQRWDPRLGVKCWWDALTARKSA